MLLVCLITGALVHNTDDEAQSDNYCARDHHDLLRLISGVEHIRMHVLERCMEHLILCATLAHQLRDLLSSIKVIDKVAHVAPKYDKNDAEASLSEHCHIQKTYVNLLLQHHRYENYLDNEQD